MARDRRGNTSRSRNRGRKDRRSSNRRRGSNRRRNSRRGGSSLNGGIIAGISVVVLVVGLLAWLALLPKSGEKQHAVCALIVDRTGSSLDPQTRSSYEDRAASTIQGCRDIKSRMVVFYFDSQSAKLQPASDSQPFTLFRPETRRESTGEKVVSSAMAQARESVASVFTHDSGRGRGSDIVTAIDLAAQDLNSLAAKDSVAEKYMVILTDGYQTGPEISMKGTFKSEDVPTKELLDKVKAYSLIPNLDGTRISFVGVGGGVTSTKDQVPEWYEAKVSAFWEEFVAAGGGQLCAYRVEASSLPGQC